MQKGVKSMKKRVGHIVFVVGVVLAVILGLASAALPAELKAWLYSVLIVFGIIAGLLNVAGKETKEFLGVATMVAVVWYVSSAATGEVGLGSVQYIGKYLVGVFHAAMSFILPAVVVVGLKDIYHLIEIR